METRSLDFDPVRVSVVGTGCMGRGIAFQVEATPGLSLSWIADTSAETALQAIPPSLSAAHGTDCLSPH